jgi:hypothetical protein
LQPINFDKCHARGGGVFGREEMTRFTDSA